MTNCDLEVISTDADGRSTLRCRRPGCGRTVAVKGSKAVLVCRDQKDHLGDKVGRVIFALTGVKTDDCESCVERRAKLNRIF